MKRVLCIFAVFLIAVLCTITVQSTESKKILKVGAAVADISPVNLPAAVNGGFTTRFLKEIEDPLCARALVIDNGQTRFAFVTIDTCVMPLEFHERIKKIVHEKTGFPIDHICTSATHTHYAPALIATLGCDRDDKYCEYFPAKAAEAVIKAIGNLREAKVGFITAREPRHVFCRRFIMAPGTAKTVPAAFSGVPRDIAQMNPGATNPNKISRTGYPDQTIYILAFRDLDDTPIALWANYSTHYAGGPKNLSADYFGVFAARIKEMIGAPAEFVAMMSNGTSGDMNCSDFLDPNQPKYDYKIVGEHVAETVFDAWKNIKYTTWVPMASQEQKLTLNVRMPSAQQVKEATAYMAKLKSEGKKPRTFTDVYALETTMIAQEAPTRELKLQAIRIGSLGICAIPGEIFSYTGHSLRASTPFETNCVISLANGYVGYIPTTEQFELGGYTTWRARSSLMETEAEPKIRSVLNDMLDKISR